MNDMSGRASLLSQGAGISTRDAEVLLGTVTFEDDSGAVVGVFADELQ